MSISLTDHPYTPVDVARLAENLMAQPVRSAEAIGKGANSRVYRLRTSSGDYVMKFYFQHPEDTRERLVTEFRSLSFLWEHGIQHVPQPLHAWPQQACALYAWVEGHSPAGQATDADLDQAIDFLKILKGLKKFASDKNFTPASEAFFSASDIVKHLRKRLNRFDFEDNSDEYGALREYLRDDFLPLLGDVETWSKGYLTSRGVSWEQELSEQYRTLSPSDFGFHNALQGSSGRIVFLDFEYFGWDDPVKTVSDFLWHPAMSLTEALKKGFADRMQEVFGDDGRFKTRLRAFFPLFGLKWCLIFLNEFVALDRQRRGFAQMMGQDKTAVCLNQLAKAKVLSHRIRSCYKDFPYGN